MKDKILLFSIGVLVGAIIATGIFYFYTKADSSSNTPDMQMFEKREKGEFNGERPNGERPNGRPNQANN